MDPSEMMKTYIRLKREVLGLALQICRSESAVNRDHTVYTLNEGDLVKLDVADRNQILTEHLGFLKGMLDSMDKEKHILHRDSLDSIASPAPAAGGYAGFKRGREAELSSLAPGAKRPAAPAAAERLPAPKLTRAEPKTADQAC